MKSFAIICIINIFPDNLSTILVAQEDNINANTALTIIDAANSKLLPLQIYQQLKESDSRISLNSVNEVYLTALARQSGATTKQVDELTRWIPKLNQTQINKVVQEIQSSRNSSGMFTGLANHMENVFKMIESLFKN